MCLNIWPLLLARGLGGTLISLLVIWVLNYSELFCGLFLYKFIICYLTCPKWSFFAYIACLLFSCLSELQLDLLYTKLIEFTQCVLQGNRDVWIRNLNSVRDEHLILIKLIILSKITLIISFHHIKKVLLYFLGPLV